MPRRDDTSRVEAARVYQETHNVSETARRVGVHRTTVHEWLKEPGFLSQEEPGEPDEETGVRAFVPKAMQVIDDALSGKKISNNQFRAALEVLKATDSLRGKEGPEGSSLADLIAKIDAEAPIESD